jgi:glycine dehydrogenase subunit 1
MRAAAYLAAMGPEGIRNAAVQCVSKAHYLQQVLDHAGLRPVYPGRAFFHEFVTECEDPAGLNRALEEKQILGGLPLDGNRILWCATEMNTREEMDMVADTVKEVLGR